MPTQRLLVPVLVTCATAFPVTVAALATMARSGPWTDPEQLGWAWITGLTVGSFSGLYAYGRATERDAESAGRDDEPPDDLGEDD